MDENTRQTIDAVVRGLFFFYPEIAAGYFPAPSVKKDVLEKEFEGVKKEDFEKGLLKLTKASDLLSSIEAIAQWQIDIERGKELKATVPTNIEELVKKAEQEPTSYQQSRQRATESLEASIKNAQSLKSKRDQVFFEAKEEEKTVLLTEEQSRVIKYVHKDAKDFRDKVVEKIVEQGPQNTPVEIRKENAEFVTNLFIAKVLEIDPNVKEVVVDNTQLEILGALSKEDSPTLSGLFTNQKETQLFSYLAKAELIRQVRDSVVAAETISNALGVDVSFTFIPTQLRELEITTEEKPTSTASVEVNRLISQVNSSSQMQRRMYNSLLEENPDILYLSSPDKAKLMKKIAEEVEKQGRATRAFNYLRFRNISLPLNTQETRFHFSPPTQIQTLYSKGVQYYRTSYLPNSIGGISTSSSFATQLVNIGAEAAMKKIIQKAGVNRVATAMTTKVAAKMAATKLGTAVASNFVLPPVIGQIVSAIQIALSLKDIASAVKVFLSKHQDSLLVITGGAMILGFAYTRSLPFLILGGGFVGYAKRATIRLFFSNALFTLTGLFVASFLIPALIALIAIPVIVIIILFIINSGAYLVPPNATASSETIESKYIRVTKNAFPAGPFANDIDITVKYTISVTAKESTLTNIVFTYNCSVFSEEAKTCPTPTEITAAGVPYSDFTAITPIEIAPEAAYTISYVVYYPAGEYNDSAITDTFSVTAAANGEITTAQGGKTIIIGEPPTACFDVDPDFPDNEEKNLYAAIYHLRTAHPAYVVKLCSAWDTIYLKYWKNAYKGVWGWWKGGGKILLAKKGLQNELYAIFILGHETGHALHDGSPQYLAQYNNFPGVKSERPLCTYDATHTPEEAFAEAIGLYAVGDGLWSTAQWGCLGGSFPNKYPNHYQFAKDVIFEE